MHNDEEGNLNEDGEDTKAGPVVEHAGNGESQRERTANTQVGQLGQEEQEKYINSWDKLNKAVKLYSQYKIYKKDKVK
jgi:hypothetical protein